MINSVAGVLLALIGIITFIFLKPDNFYDLEKISLIGNIIACIIIEISAFICFITGKSNSKRAAQYYNEIILLENLNNSIELIKDMNDKPNQEEIIEDGTGKKTIRFRSSDKDKMRLLICQALLNRYSR